MLEDGDGMVEEKKCEFCEQPAIGHFWYACSEPGCCNDDVLACADCAATYASHYTAYLFERAA